MSVIAALVLFIVGLAIVLFSAEQLVKGVVGTSIAFRVSSFAIAVVFIGFDPDNLSVGAVASFEQAPGIAWGAIIGAAMVAVAFAFGVSALFAPMSFGDVPVRILIVPLLAITFLGLLGIDGQLSRLDGTALIGAYAISVLWVWHQSRKGLEIQAAGEIGHTLQKAHHLRRWPAAALLGVSLVGVIVGSEMLVAASKPILNWLNVSETVFGMTILAFVVSIEELARELPPALKGRPEISFGNVLGSTLAMFLFNAGTFALVRPVPVPPDVLRFYLPYSFVSLAVISAFIARRHVPRWAGALFVALYAMFVAGTYWIR